jgi:dihydroorotate dehydrogenase (NAD+) catalytic subunit
VSAPEVVTAREPAHAPHPTPQSLAAELCGVPLRSPILLASGTCGYGTELAPFVDLAALGGIVAKSLTLAPREGNVPPRITETPAGMLNAISLENVGVERFLTEKLPALPASLPVFASVFETEIERYAAVCAALSGSRVAGLELNASCPHVKAGGIEFGQDPRALARLVAACRGATRKPLLVKLSPNVTSIVEMARVCQGEGADGVSLINTLQGLEVDVERRRLALRNGIGGLSGPAIRPVALRMVYQVAQALPDLPICGMGGIMTGEDAARFMLCGARAVQVGTASYLRPDAALSVRDELAAYLARQGIAKVGDLVGTIARWT